MFRVASTPFRRTAGGFGGPSAPCCDPCRQLTSLPATDRALIGSAFDVSESRGGNNLMARHAASVPLLDLGSVNNDGITAIFQAA